MDDMKTINLPREEDLLARLIGVMDESHAIEYFYPLILEHAGEQKNGMGVVMLLMLAVEDYTANLPPVMKNLIYPRLHQYVTGIVDDEEVRADALEMLEQAGIGPSLVPPTGP